MESFVSSQMVRSEGSCQQLKRVYHSRVSASLSSHEHLQFLHSVVISAYGEGEATLHIWLLRVGISILQNAGGEDGFLHSVERYRAKLLPVAN